MPKALNCSTTTTQNLINSKPNISSAPWIFAVCGFPYRNPNFENKSSNLIYNLSTGDRQEFFLSSRNGLPYGVMPRRIINYICHQVKTNDSRIISLGKSKHDIVKKILNKDVGGRDYIQFEEQFFRTLETMFHYSYDKPRSKPTKTLDYYAVETKAVPIGNYKVSDNFWDDITGDGVLVISEAFMEIINHSFPVNDDKLKLLTSPRQIDLYEFFHRQNHQLCDKYKAPFTYDYKFLKDIFGKDFPDTIAGRAHFRLKLGEAVKTIQSLDNFNIKPEDSGLKLTPDHSLIFYPNDSKIYASPQLQQSTQPKPKQYINPRDTLVDIIEPLELEKLSDNIVKQLAKCLKLTSPDYIQSAVKYAKQNYKINFDSYLGNTLNHPEWHSGLLDSMLKQKVQEEDKIVTTAIITHLKSIPTLERNQNKDSVKAGLEKILENKTYQSLKLKSINEDVIRGLLATYETYTTSTEFTHKTFNFRVAIEDVRNYHWLIKNYPEIDHTPALKTTDSMLGFYIAQLIAKNV